MRYAAVFAAALALAPAPERTVLAHETGAGGPEPGRNLPLLSVSAEVDPGAPVPPAVEVPLGARVRLAITGARGAELHLHGYDVLASGGSGETAVIVFDAVHEGRFPVEMHVEADLLGRRGKPVLFVEVRGN